MQLIKLVIFSFLLFFNTTLFAETIQISTGDWMPFVHRDLKHQGFVAHIVQSAFKASDIDVKLNFYPWKRALLSLNSGSEDASILWAKSEDRKNQYLFSEPVVQGKIVFYHLKSSTFDWSDYTDLSRYRIGASLGYSYSEDFQQALNNKVFKVENSKDDISNLHKLLNGRIDAFPLRVTVGTALLNKNFSAEERAALSYHPKSISEAPLHLMVAKNNPRHQWLLEKFNNGLAIIRANGVYDKILKDNQEGLYSTQ